MKTFLTAFALSLATLTSAQAFDHVRLVGDLTLVNIDGRLVRPLARSGCEVEYVVHWAGGRLGSTLILTEERFPTIPLLRSGLVRVLPQSPRDTYPDDWQYVVEFALPRDFGGLVVRCPATSDTVGLSDEQRAELEHLFVFE